MIIVKLFDLEFRNQGLLRLLEHGAHLRAHAAHTRVFLEFLAADFVDQALAVFGERAFRLACFVVKGDGGAVALAAVGALSCV